MATNDSIILSKSNDKVHKFQVKFPNNKKVKFGRKGYSDYTIHKDKNRMKRYLNRHKKRENWTVSGQYTPGFWSRHVLWSKPNLKSAVSSTSRLLKKKIVIKNT